MDDLDDIAFLDAQIEKIQTSHGRTIDAAGKGYRTIVSTLSASTVCYIVFDQQQGISFSYVSHLQVNGILLAKPLPKEEPKRNGAAATNLQAKLQSKSHNRKVKKKSK
jgi:hypothetical protein